MVGLLSSEDRSRLVENSPETIIVISLDGTIRFVNYATASERPEEIVGTSIFEHVSTRFHSRMQECFQQVQLTGQTGSYEIARPSENGSDDWLSTRVVPFRMSDGTPGLMLSTRDVTESKRTAELLRSRESRLQGLLETLESDRKMISHEIHDGLLQQIIGVQMYLETAKHWLGSDPGMSGQTLDRMSGLLGEAIDEARRIVNDLSPLNTNCIVPSLKKFVEAQQTESGVSLSFAHDDTVRELDARLGGAIFRVVQEALSNVRRHSEAGSAQIKISQLDDTVEIQVRDDGIGFELNSVSPDCFGIRGIRERAEMFGGHADIVSAPGEGTIVRVEFPCRTSERAKVSLHAGI